MICHVVWRSKDHGPIIKVQSGAPVLKSNWWSSQVCSSEGRKERGKGGKERKGKGREGKKGEKGGKERKGKGREGRGKGDLEHIKVFISS